MKIARSLRKIEPLPNPPRRPLSKPDETPAAFARAAFQFLRIPAEFTASAARLRSGPPPFRPARLTLRIPVPFLRDCRHAASCRMRLPIKGPSPFAASLSAIPAPTGEASPLPRFLLLSNMD